jgi:hypothetical protein
MPAIGRNPDAAAPPVCESRAMSWLQLLMAAAAIVAVAALTGFKPRGTRPVARTRLMKAARLVLLLIAAGFVVLALLAGTGGG